MNVPDAYSAFVKYEAERDAWLANRPLCDECKDHIQEERCYQTSDGIICEFCIDKYKVWTEDLMS